MKLIAHKVAWKMAKDNTKWSIRRLANLSSEFFKIRFSLAHQQNDEPNVMYCYLYSASFETSVISNLKLARGGVCNVKQNRVGGFRAIATKLKGSRGEDRVAVPVGIERSPVTRRSPQTVCTIFPCANMKAIFVRRLPSRSRTMYLGCSITDVNALIASTW